MNIPTLQNITLRQQAKMILLAFDNGERFELSCGYLRFFSPSADTKHKKNKRFVDVEHVNITQIQPVGHYAVRLVFDDGHQTGLYTWSTLYKLAGRYQPNWHDFIEEQMYP